MRYQWDDDKERNNIAAHGVSLSLAVSMFEFAVVEFPDPHPGEDRIRALGSIDNRVLFCVYTDRGDVRRIISLRKATGNEQKTYYRELQR